MIFKSKSVEVKADEAMVWHRVFALCPVRIGPYHMAWLRWVWRRCPERNWVFLVWEYSLAKLEEE